jgi:hypothetical protein
LSDLIGDVLVGRYQTCIEAALLTTFTAQGSKELGKLTLPR